MMSNLNEILTEMQKSTRSTLLNVQKQMIPELKQITCTKVTFPINFGTEILREPSNPSAKMYRVTFNDGNCDLLVDKSPNQVFVETYYDAIDNKLIKPFSPMTSGCIPWSLRHISKIYIDDRTMYFEIVETISTPSILLLFNDLEVIQDRVSTILQPNAIFSFGANRELDKTSPTFQYLDTGNNFIVEKGTMTSEFLIPKMDIKYKLFKENIFIFRDGYLHSPNWEERHRNIFRITNFNNTKKYEYVIVYNKRDVKTLDNLIKLSEKIDTVQQLISSNPLPQWIDLIKNDFDFEYNPNKTPEQNMESLKQYILSYNHEALYKYFKENSNTKSICLSGAEIRPQIKNNRFYLSRRFDDSFSYNNCIILFKNGLLDEAYNDRTMKSTMYDFYINSLELKDDDIYEFVMFKNCNMNTYPVIINDSNQLLKPDNTLGKNYDDIIILSSRIDNNHLFNYQEDPDRLYEIPHTKVPLNDGGFTVRFESEFYYGQEVILTSKRQFKHARRTLPIIDDSLVSGKASCDMYDITDISATDVSNIRHLDQYMTFERRTYSGFLECPNGVFGFKDPTFNWSGIGTKPSFINKDKFILDINFWINIKEHGEYSFSMLANQGAGLFINGVDVIGRLYRTGANDTYDSSQLKATVYLKKGYNKINIKYYNISIQTPSLALSIKRHYNGLQTTYRNLPMNNIYTTPYSKSDVPAGLTINKQVSLKLIETDILANTSEKMDQVLNTKNKVKGIYQKNISNRCGFGKNFSFNNIGFGDVPEILNGTHTKPYFVLEMEMYYNSDTVPSSFSFLTHNMRILEHSINKVTEFYNNPISTSMIYPDSVAKLTPTITGNEFNKITIYIAGSFDSCVFAWGEERQGNGYRNVSFDTLSNDMYGVITAKLSADFKYCLDPNKYLVFLNGRKLDNSLFKIGTPGLNKVYDTNYIIINSNTSKDDIIDIFYVPDSMINTSIMSTVSEDGIIKFPNTRAGIDYILDSSLSLMFINGKKIASCQTKTYNATSLKLLKDFNTRIELEIVHPNIFPEDIRNLFKSINDVWTQATNLLSAQQVQQLVNNSVLLKDNEELAHYAPVSGDYLIWNTIYEFWIKRLNRIDAEDVFVYNDDEKFVEYPTRPQEDLIPLKVTTEYGSYEQDKLLIWMDGYDTPITHTDNKQYVPNKVNNQIYGELVGAGFVYDNLTKTYHLPNDSHVITPDLLTTRADDFTISIRGRFSKLVNGKWDFLIAPYSLNNLSESICIQTHGGGAGYHIDCLCENRIGYINNSNDMNYHTYDLVFNSSTNDVKIYLDGVLRTTNSYGNKAHQTIINKKLCIGKSWNSDISSNVDFQSFRYYTKCLTESEIYNNYITDISRFDQSNQYISDNLTVLLDANSKPVLNNGKMYIPNKATNLPYGELVGNGWNRSQVNCSYHLPDNSYIITPDLLTTRADDFTISLRARLDKEQLYNYPGLIGNKRVGNDVTESFALFANSSKTELTVLALCQSYSGKLFNWDSNYHTFDFVFSSITNNVKLYIDGVLIKTNTYGNKAGQEIQFKKIYIGEYFGQGNVHFQSFRYYTKCLTQEEINHNYNTDMYKFDNVNEYIQEGLLTLLDGRSESIISETKKYLINQVDNKPLAEIVGDDVIHNGDCYLVNGETSTIKIPTELSKTRNSTISFRLLLDSTKRNKYPRYFASTSTPSRLLLRFDTVKTGDWVRALFYGNSSNNIPDDSLPFNMYNNIDITYNKDNRKYKLYINGKFVLEGISTDVEFGDNIITLFTDSLNYGFANGKFQSFRYYNRELTHQEILHNYSIDNKIYGDNLNYIPNGLISYIDSKSNTVTNTDNKQWLPDLISGSPAALVEANGIVKDANGYTVDGTITGLKLNTPIFSKSSSFTMSFRLLSNNTINDNNNWMTVLCNSHNTPYSKRISIMGETEWNNVGVNFGKDFIKSRINGYNTEVYNTVDFVFNHLHKKCYFYINGTLNDTLLLSDIEMGENFEPNNMMYLFRALDRVYSSSGTFQCFRMYNRALDSEEIRKNFTVDEYRFTLGEQKTLDLIEEDVHVPRLPKDVNEDNEYFNNLSISKDYIDETVIIDGYNTRHIKLISGSVKVVIKPDILPNDMKMKEHSLSFELLYNYNQYDESNYPDLEFYNSNNKVQRVPMKLRRNNIYPLTNLIPPKTHFIRLTAEEILANQDYTDMYITIILNRPGQELFIRQGFLEKHPHTLMGMGVIPVDATIDTGKLLPYDFM